MLETKLRHLPPRGDEKYARSRRSSRRSVTRSTKSSRARRGSPSSCVRSCCEDAEEYGDARRTKLVEREAAQAIAEVDLIASEPTTVVLSRLGWVRAAKDMTSMRAGSPSRPVTSSRLRRRGKTCSRRCSSIPPAAPTVWTRISCLPRAATGSRCGNCRSSGRRDVRGGVDRQSRGTCGWWQAMWGMIQGEARGSFCREEGNRVLKVPENARVLPAPPSGDPAALAVLVNNQGEVLSIAGVEFSGDVGEKGQNLLGIPGEEIGRSG